MLAFHETEVLAIKFPALPRFTLGELQAKHSWIRSIKCDASPTEAVMLILGTFLRSDERWIEGREYGKRRKPYSYLGIQHAIWFVDHQSEFVELTALFGNVFCIDFPGIVVVHEEDERGYFPCLKRVDDLWTILWCWASAGMFLDGRVASFK